MHVRYPEARAGASEIEKRLRRAHELLLEGLVRRGEWRDREALDCMRRAREVWPDLPGAETLITATENRLSLFERSQALAMARRSPAGTQGDAPAVTPRPEPTVAPGDPLTAAAGPEAGVDPISTALVAIETRLARGEFELVVVDLLDLSRRFPGDARVRFRLGRVLHQRALLRYGQGGLVSAIEDWERVLTCDPSNEVVPELLAKARGELLPAAPR
jgi:hypothetical protein